MKKFLLASLYPLSLMALYNGNPSLPMMPEKGIWIPKDIPIGIKTGYEVDWTYDANLDFHSTDNLHHDGHGYKALMQSGVITVNFIDRVEIFTNLGGFSCQWHQEGEGEQSLFYKSDTSWIWGVGGRAILAYWGDLQLSGNASYVDSSPSKVKLHIHGSNGETEDSDAHFNAWQIGGGITYRFGWFYPYVGVDYLNMSLDTGPFKSVDKKKLCFEMEDPFGIYLGLGVGLDRGWNFNIEARFINENAISFSTDIRF